MKTTLRRIGRKRGVVQSQEEKVKGLTFLVGGGKMSRMLGSMFLVCAYQTSFLYSYAVAYIFPMSSDLIR